MLNYVNWRMRVTIADGRVLLGTFMAFDKHMNLVLADTEEYRRVKGKKSSEEKEEKRMLGLVLLRGENVISLQADSPPPPKPRAAQVAAAGRGGPGMGRAAGRGMVSAPLAAPQGLTGSVKGLGGPGSALMQPMAPVGRGAVMAAQPVTYGRGAPGAPGSGGAPGGGATAFPPAMMGRGGPGMPGMPPFGMPMGFNPMMMGRGAPPPPMGFNPMMMGRGGPMPPFPMPPTGTAPPPPVGRGTGAPPGKQ